MGDVADRLVRRGLFIADSVLCELGRVVREEEKEDGPRSRFARIETRSWTTDLCIPGQVVQAIQGAKWNTAASETPPVNWRGTVNMKDPFSLAAYPMLLWDLKPATVIEIGAYHGGSACWLADQAAAMGIDLRVVSFDIDVDRIVATHPRVTFARADSNDVASFDRARLAPLPHPWLVIEDAHVNVASVLELFDSMMREGDYFIVEDVVDRAKYEAMRGFVIDAAGRYLVDTRFTDLFGYNVTWHPNGYLRRVR
jgi:cephalosporin hydroxylase